MNCKDTNPIHHCNFPNGQIRRRDGTTYPIACEHPAEYSLQRWWLCEAHAGMVARGCLDHFYTNGETIREAMEKTALYNLLADGDDSSSSLPSSDPQQS